MSDNPDAVYYKTEDGWKWTSSQGPAKFLLRNLKTGNKAVIHVAEVAIPMGVLQDLLESYDHADIAARLKAVAADAWTMGEIEYFIDSIESLRGLASQAWPYDGSLPHMPRDANGEGRSG